jgi:hypothetical protein
MWRIVIPALVLVAQPALAQTCDASGPAGEVIVTRDGRGGSAVWVVAREANIGEETDHFSRPGFEVEFKLRPDGTLGDVASATAAITRVSDDRIGPAPLLGQITIRAKLDGKVLSWRGDKTADGELSLAWALLKQWPAKLEVEVTPVAGGPLYASATFDLSELPKAQELTRTALETCGG